MKKKQPPAPRPPHDVMRRFDRLLAAMAPKAAAPKTPTPPKPRVAKRRRTSQAGKARTK